MDSRVNPQLVKWDRRHRERSGEMLGAPDGVVAEAVADVRPGGRALDLACGAGRHAVWLAARGWEVEAVDGSAVALAQLRGHADRAGAGHRVTTIEADLEAEPPAFAIGAGRYALIVDCGFLHRPLFDAIRAGVAPGGLFVAALHLPAAAAGPGRGHRFVVAPGELERMATGWGWTIVHARERAGATDGHDQGVAELVARRPR